MNLLALLPLAAGDPMDGHGLPYAALAVVAVTVFCVGAVHIMVWRDRRK